VKKRQPAKLERCVKDVKRRGAAVSPYAVCRASLHNTGPSVAKKTPVKTNRAKRKNPAAAAAEAYKVFHGKDSDKVLTVRKAIHYHGHLFGVGELIQLDVETLDGKYVVHLDTFKGAMLSGNEEAVLEAIKNGKSKPKYTQLFIEAGDQRIPLEKFGIDPRNLHEDELLGQVTLVDYDTDKQHLLAEDGGEGIYRHKFRSTNVDGKHVVVKWTRYPWLRYEPRNQALYFTGGSYELRAEGIDL
jgi:hypothetical protein